MVEKWNLDNRFIHEEWLVFWALWAAWVNASRCVSSMDWCQRNAIQNKMQNERNRKRQAANLLCLYAPPPLPRTHTLTSHPKTRQHMGPATKSAFPGTNGGPKRPLQWARAGPRESCCTRHHLTNGCCVARTRPQRVPMHLRCPLLFPPKTAANGAQHDHDHKCRPGAPTACNRLHVPLWPQVPPIAAPLSPAHRHVLTPPPPPKSKRLPE